MESLSQDKKLKRTASEMLESCGDFDMRIASNGQWSYRGSPIGRKELVKLFATVLRREDDGTYWLVTPVERGLIEVEDVPFVVVDWQERKEQLWLATNLDLWFPLNSDHPLKMETKSNKEPRPYALAVPEKGGLWARLSRPVFYQLAERAKEEKGQYWLASGDQRFSLGTLEQ